jgi:hypothetical protein
MIRKRAEPLRRDYLAAGRHVYLVRLMGEVYEEKRRLDWREEGEGGSRGGTRQGCESSSGTEMRLAQARNEEVPTRGQSIRGDKAVTQAVNSFLQSK